jgi:hypothetical protein
LSNQYDTEAQVNKLKNQYANYSIRNDLYYIRAAQNGYINRALQAGIGETIKEGTPIYCNAFRVRYRNLKPFRFAFNFQRCQNKNLV